MTALAREEEGGGASSSSSLSPSPSSGAVLVLRKLRWHEMPSRALYDCTEAVEAVDAVDELPALTTSSRGRVDCCIIRRTISERGTVFFGAHVKGDERC